MTAMKRVVRGLLLCVGLATLLASSTIVVVRWNALASSFINVDLRWLAAGSALLLVCFAVLGAAWSLLVSALGGKLRPADCFVAFSLSQLPKYVPGRIAGHGVRITVATRAGVPLAIAVASVAIEGALGLTGALLVAILGSLARSEVVSANAGRWLVLAFAVMLAFASVGALFRSSAARWRTRLGLTELRIRPWRLAAIGLTYLGCWFLIGGANWFLANAISPLSVSLLFPMTVAVAVATGLGQLAVFSPGGIGVREGALFLFASAWMTDSDALGFVALARLVAIVIEALLTAVGGLYSLRARPAPARPSNR